MQTFSDIFLQQCEVLLDCYHVFGFCRSVEIPVSSAFGISGLSVPQRPGGGLCLPVSQLHSHLWRGSASPSCRWVKICFLFEWNCIYLFIYLTIIWFKLRLFNHGVLTYVSLQYKTEQHNVWTLIEISAITMRVYKHTYPCQLVYLPNMYIWKANELGFVFSCLNNNNHQTLQIFCRCVHCEDSPQSHSFIYIYIYKMYIHKKYSMCNCCLFLSKEFNCP